MFITRADIHPCHILRTPFDTVCNSLFVSTYNLWRSLQADAFISVLQNSSSHPPRSRIRGGTPQECKRFVWRSRQSATEQRGAAPWDAEGSKEALGTLGKNLGKCFTFSPHSTAQGVLTTTLRPTNAHATTTTDSPHCNMCKTAL